VADELVAELADPMNSVFSPNKVVFPLQTVSKLFAIQIFKV